MNIIFVTSEFLDEYGLYPGGIASYIDKISKIFNEQGYKVRIIQPSLGKNCKLFGEIEILFADEVNNYLLKVLNLFTLNKFKTLNYNILLSYSLNKKLREEIAKSKDNLIVQYTNYRLIHLLAPLKLKNVKFFLRISSLHEFWNNKSYLSLQDRVIIFLERYGIKRFENLFGPGNFLLDYLKLNKIIQNATVIPTPYNVQNLENKVIVRNKKVGKVKILYVGSISYFKGSTLLLKIIDKLLNKFQDNFEVELIGKIGFDFNIDIELTINRLRNDFPTSFFHHSNLDREKIGLSMEESSILLIPSIVDNFPNVALEGLFKGCQLIVGSNCSLDNLINESGSGLILETRDPEIWIDSILELASKESWQIDLSEILEIYGGDNASCCLKTFYNNGKN